jgi:hypothetical protein
MKAKRDEPEAEVCPVCDSRMAMVGKKDWRCVCGAQGVILAQRLCVMSAPIDWHYFEPLKHAEIIAGHRAEKAKIAREREAGVIE